LEKDESRAVSGRKRHQHYYKGNEQHDMQDTGQKLNPWDQEPGVHIHEPFNNQQSKDDQRNMVCFGLVVRVVGHDETLEHVG